ncbi:tape measure protein [Aliarcobacter butzleri]
MAQTLGTLLIDVKADTQQLIQGFNRAETTVNKATKSMGNAIKALAGAYVSLSAIDLARSYAKQVDAITTVNNRLKLVTKSTQELTNAQNELYKISQSTSMSYSATGDLYSRVARSTKELNLSQTELLGITDSINKAMIISGGTAESMNAALVQLGQAFSADFKAVGQELGSIREQTPRLYEAIVKGMGVTSAQFKKMAEDGKLSSEMIINALKSQGVVLNEEYAKFTKTIDQSFQNLSNSGQKLINDFDKITGISKSVSENIIGISSAIDSLDVEQIANLAEYAKNAAIAIGLSYTALKAGTIAVSAYNSILESNNRINKLNIDIETSKAKAYSDGMKALYARKMADEALNTGMLNGVELSKKKINQLQKEATTLENVAKRQQAYSYQLEGTARGFNIATLGANALRTALNTIPFMALSVGISLVISKLIETGKEQEKLNEIMNSSKDKLKENTDAQLKYALSLLESETATLRLARANAIAAASSQGMFQSEQDFKKDQANRDLAIKSFDENIKKIREIKDLLAEKNQNNLLANNKGTSTAPSFDTSSIDDMVNKVLNPYQSKLDEINKKWKEQFDILKKNGKDTTGVTAAWNAEIQKLNEDTAKANEKSLKAENKNIEERISQYANYYEKIKDFSSLWAIEEQRLRKENTALTESELNKLLEIERQNFNERFTLQKDILTADDWKEYYLKIGEYGYAWQIELSENFDKWKALAGEKLPELVELYKTEFFDKISKEEIKPFEFDIDLDGFDTPITNTLKSFDKLNEATREYNKYIKQTGLTKEQIAKADEKNTSNQLKGYSNMAGAISEMFEKGSREAAAFQIAQSSLALVEGTRAILTAGTGDPYTAIPRMIAMGAMVSSLLSNIGVAFGISGKATVINTTQPINTGSGTVLGETTKASESVSKSLSILEDFAEPQFQVLSEMNKNIKTITDSLGGVTKLLIQQGGFAFGEGYTGFDTGFKNKVSLNSLTVDLLNPINTIISKIPILGQINGLFQNFLGSALNKVMGGLFGKTSVSQALTDSGLYFSNQLLTNAIQNMQGSAYQTILTIITEKSWTKKSTTAYFQDYFQKLDNETTRQFSLVLSSLYDTVLLSGEALDSTSAETAKSLKKFVVSIGKISLKGKTSEQIQETLTSIFGKIGDQIAKTAFPALVDFQKVGEGLFETLTRVATGMEEAEYYASRLGKSFQDIKYTDILNKQGEVGFEALLQIISNTEKALYPTNNGLLDIISNLNSTTEELYSTYVALDELRDRIIFLGQSSQGLTNSMIYGAGSIGELQNGFKDFFDNFLSDEEKLAYNTSQLIKSFDDIGVAIPTSKDAFRALLSSIDLTSESGQELYGRLITLSGSFSDVYDEVEKVNSVLIETFSNLKGIALDFINSFNRSGTSDTRSQILRYNELRNQFENLFDVSGVLKAGTDTSKASDLYTQLSSLGKTLGNANSYLVDSLVSQFEQDINRFDFATDVMKVSIISGLGDLETLTKAQIEQLKTISTEQLLQLQNGTIPTFTNTTTNSVPNLLNFSIFEDLKGIISDIAKNISDYPQKTFKILDDVVNGFDSMNVKVTI